tara:strand:- start:97 stop:504 length:408 start_codon:yes stop_codon:yes gene_type:complete
MRKTLNRSRHDEVVKITIWANELTDHYTQHPATVQDVIVRYKQKTGTEVSATTFKTVFEQLGIPFRQTRRKGSPSNRSRIDRLCFEVRELSDKLDKVIRLAALESMIQTGRTKGITALCGRHRDPADDDQNESEV